MKCKKCNHEINVKVNFCPNCGAPFAKAPKKSSFGTILALVALVILVLYMAGMLKL